MRHMRTWCVNDGQIGAVFVLNLDHNLLRPELLLPLQAAILVLNVVLRHASSACESACTPRHSMAMPATAAA